MLDTAGQRMAEGQMVAAERCRGMNDNMSKSHTHSFYEIYYLEKGERYHFLDDQLYKLTEGQLILFRPQEVHHSYGDKDVEFIRTILYFTPEVIRNPKLLRSLSKMSGVHILERTKEISQLLELATQEDHKQENFYEIALENLANQILVAILRDGPAVHDTPFDQRISRVISYINENYAQKISLQQLADEFYVSKWHLCREFKENAHLTIIQYINYTRVAHAQKMLLDLDVSVTSIGNEVGFDSLTHFERVFKQNTGMTPKHYREITTQSNRPS